ncbi:MAG: 50S ribosomal protein L18 [Candidatus Bathyarchaeia archaeon]
MPGLPLKRRRLKRTDYRKRLRLILSGKPRLVVRGANKNYQVQAVVAEPQGDRVLASASTMELSKLYGWKASRGNIPSAYLAGYLLGLRALGKGIEEAVLDTGLARLIRGSRASAAMKGALDAGLKVPHGEDVFPDEERIRGIHIARYADSLQKMNPELYKKTFSAYLAGGIRPEELPQHFEATKTEIDKSFGRG